MATSLKSPEVDAREALEARWKAQVAAVAAAGDQLALELRRLATVFKEADLTFGPVVYGGAGTIAPLGFELPHQFIARFLGSDYTPAWELWKQEAARRGWLNR